MGGPNGRGTSQGRDSGAPGRDDVDHKRGGDAGTDGRARGPARPDSGLWQNSGAPDREPGGQGGGDRGGAAQGWGPRDRGGTEQGWGNQGRGGTGSDWGGRGTDRRVSGKRASAWQTGRDSGAAQGYGPEGRESRRGGAGGWAGDQGPADGLTGPPSRPFFRRIGSLPARFGVYVMLCAALLAVFGTLLTGREPGFLLGLLVIVSSVVAALVIRLRAVYLLIPLPALLLFLTAVLTGAVKDSSIDTSRTALGVSFLQWIAAVFFPICVATILVLVIAAGRWLLSLQFVAGHFSASGGGGAEREPRTATGPRADRGRRTPGDSDPWGAAAPWDDRGSTGGPRTSRDPGDPWGNRRQPFDRGQPGGQQPAGGTRPGDRTMPSDRGQRDQRDPRDPWGKRLNPGA